MLKVLIEQAEELIAVGKCNNRNYATISISGLEAFVAAAKLLYDVHEMVDSGELDGVDLDWMVNEDRMIVGQKSA